MAEPSKKDPLDAELEREIAEALGDTSLLGITKSRRGAPPIPLPDLPAGQSGAGQPEPQSFATGVIAGVGEEDVFVEFGPRAQGVVPRAHFGTEPALGEPVRVFVEAYDAKEGLFVCALKKTVQSASGWGSVSPGAVVVATVRAENKGGLTVQIGHLAGFLPASHLALERVEDLASVIGQTFPVEVIECDPERRKLVVSRRSVLAREREERRQVAMRELVPGDVRSGSVTRVEPFGAFVDLGGVEGLVHVSQLAWKRVEDPTTVVKPGDVVKVQVLEVKEGGKLSLGMKQLTEDPWLRFAREHPVGSVLEGKVTRLERFGAFVEIADGVEGLAHVSQLAPHPVHSPREVVRPGDVISVRVANVDFERHRIGLSLLTERGDRLTDDVADDATIRDVLGRGDPAPEPTLGDLLRKALSEKPGRRPG
jgi:ribosomal protein S1